MLLSLYRIILRMTLGRTTFLCPCFVLFFRRSSRGQIRWSYLSASEWQSGRWERSQQQQQDPGPHGAAQPEEPQATGRTFSTSASNPTTAPSLVPVSCTCRLCQARSAKYKTSRCLSECLLTVTHTQARRLTLSISLFWKLPREGIKDTVGQVRSDDCYSTRSLRPHGGCHTNPNQSR